MIRSGHKIVFHFIFLFSLLISESKLYSQTSGELVIERITTENSILQKGISQNDVNCILQDSKGLLWFGTWDGLNCYDGYTFTVFKPNLENESLGISHQSVNCILEDKDGFLWIGTDKGLNRFNRNDKSFKQFLKSSVGSNNLVSDTVKSLVEDKEGNIWIGTETGLNRYDNATGGIISYTGHKEKANFGKNINQLYVDRQGIIWMATRKGLYKFNPEINKYYTLFPNTELSGKNISCILQDRMANFWIGTSSGLYKIDYNTKKLLRFKPNSADSLIFYTKKITALYEDWFGYLWIGTSGGGISLLDMQSNNIMPFKGKLKKLNDLKNEYIKSIYEDGLGIIWIGTEWKGVFKIDRSSFRFAHVSDNPNTTPHLNAKTVWAFCRANDNSLWVATDAGLNILYPNSDNFTILNTSNSKLSSNQIRDIYQAKDGKFWIGTFDGGLNVYDAENNEWKNYLPGSGTNRIPDLCVWKIFQDRYDTIWVGTNNGLCKYRPETDDFIQLHYNPDNINSLSNNTIFSIYEDSKANLWFCTYEGLNKYIRNKGAFVSYKHDHSNKFSLSVNSIFSIYEDLKHNCYWIGTMGGGLNRLDKRSGKFYYYTEKDGLPNNIVYKIYPDSRNNIWISTNHGISQFNIDNESFLNYDVRDGVQGFEFNHNAGMMDEDGYIFFGGMNGYNFFNPDNIRQNKNLAPIVISEFKIHDKIFNTDINNGDTIRLKYDQNSFSFKFAALDFTNPNKNLYQYRLKNYNDNWIQTTSELRIANFTKVKPGEYVFQIKATNSSGYWNNDVFSIYLLLKPPWWNTWVFKILMIVFIASLIFYSLRTYFRRLNRKHEWEKRMLTMQKELSEIQQKSLQLQMNPHFIFNSLNSIQHFILEQDEEAAHVYLTNFSSLMRKILENSKHPYISLHEELETIKLYLDIEKLRFSNHFEYNIKLSNKLNPGIIQIPPMLIQPYLENAIWHGLMPKNESGRIDINIEPVSEHQLKFSIRDNGIGRTRAREISKKRRGHKSTGMRNIEERIELMNQLNNTQMKVEVIDLYNDDHEAVGTEVIVFLYI